MDLMRQQVKEGNEVALLWPGKIEFIGNKTKIRRHKPVDKIENYEVINPTPVPFDEGIKDFDAFKREGNARAYELLINHVKPDVIHIHTLMGLHKSFLDVAKRNRIRLVFTAHDFFPICPKVTMFRHNQICDCINSCTECGVCNNTALNIRKIQILQSPLYRKLKDITIIKKLRKQHRDEYLGDDLKRDENGSVGTHSDYKNLRSFYYSMLSTMDIIHYNSSVTKNAYESVFDLPNNMVISITHTDIVDHRKKKAYSNDQLRIRFLGPQGGAKGYYLLKEALDRLWKKRNDFCLDVHFKPLEMTPYIRAHCRYSYNELEKIFDETDVLIAPSIWYETFGYTVLEALSYGVPVILSDTVGAKDILADGAGIVIDKISADKIAKCLECLDYKQLSVMNKAILEKQEIKTVEKMSENIENYCYMEG